MTVIRLSEEERKAEALLNDADAHYGEVVEQIQTLKLYLQDGDALSEAEIKRVLGELRRATQTLFDERKKVENLRKKEIGIVHDYALDFEDAKREIGCRLDRLRTAEGAKGVS